ncbi:MAG: DUF2207 domain-containing protein [Aerococcus sp.]|nr:DUF2207 domain-containing protein [Aerococcus sp.]
MTHTNWRRWWIIGPLLLLLLLIPHTDALAAVDQTIHQISVTVTLHKDGSATLSEVWDMTTKEGTEIYKPLKLEGEQKLSNYTVKMGGKALTYNDDWDVDDSFEEKAGTYGYNDEEELNWGITEYGRHQYEVTYTITPFVMQTTSDQMIFWQFINEGLAVPPQQINITVKSDVGAMFADQHYNVWGFGFKGETSFTNGEIHAQSNGPLTKDGKGVLLIHIPNHTFTQPLKVEGSFDDYAKSAFKGSSYNWEDYTQRDTILNGGEKPMSTTERLGIFAIICVGIVFIGGAIIATISYQHQQRMRRRGKAQYYPSLKHQSKRLRDEYAREWPTPDVFSGYQFLVDLDVDHVKENYFAVAMLVLVRDGRIILTEDKKGKPALRLNMDVDVQLEQVEPVWELLTEAMRVKGKDGLLTEKQLQRYMEEHQRPLINYVTNINQHSRDVLDDAGWSATLKISKKKTLRQWADEAIDYPLSDSGLETRDQMVRFYNYLKDYSLVNERGANEVKLWDRLLIQAAALGIADEVAETFKTLNPNFVEQSMILTPRFSILDYYLWSNIMNQSYIGATTTQSSPHSSAGFGGGTSFGGGGGSFGGGFGGGAR